MSRDLITAAHQEISHDWWDNSRVAFDLFISQLVVQEAGAGDELMAKKRLSLIEQIPLLELTQEAFALADALLHQGPLPEKAAGDALHIAVATVHGMDYLLTWNCEHIANAQMRLRVTAICAKHGYEPPIFCTPEELSGE